jgi:Epoxide hydrolase N terminus.
VLADLRRRLLQTRWPEPETVSDWSQGVPLAYLRDLCGYWADGYDWRPAEARLNALPQFQTEIDGIRIVFAHVPLAAAGRAAADPDPWLARFGGGVLEGHRATGRSG